MREEERYVIIESKDWGDYFETILPAGTTEAEARKLTKADYERTLCDKGTTIELARIRCEIERDEEQHSVGIAHIEDGYNPIPYMVTEAQKRASAKYDAENTVQLKVKLNRTTDKDIIEFLESQPNKQGFIKKLIRESMGR